MNRRACMLVLSLGLSYISGAAVAAEDAFQWLDRMSAAMSQMNYQGTFVYVRGDDVETVRITHVVDEHGSRERLVSVSGMPREVVRDAEGVRWISGDERTVMADSAANRPFFPELPLGNPSRATDSYQFRLDEVQRIAGHSGRRLDIVPKDEYRYGYRLWLETQSGLLLKWELTGLEGETLAKLMFTELKMGSEVDAAELLSTSRVADTDRKTARLSSEQQAAGKPLIWQADKLPPGFRLASHRQQPVKQGVVFEHLIYSDGIAAVSVYVESADDSAPLQLGLSKLGTTHLFSRELDGKVITALGDVPAVTVKLIGASVLPIAH